MNFFHMGATGYFTHRDCWKHEMGAGHPECPERLDAIEDRLLASGVGDLLDRREAPEAPLHDIELARIAANVDDSRRLLAPQRLGIYASLHLNAAITATEASPQTALGGTLGVGLDLIRHVAVEASIPAAVVYQGTAPTLLVGGPLQVGTRLVFGSASPTLFSERTPPRWALVRWRRKSPRQAAISICPAIRNSSPRMIPTCARPR